MGKKVKCFSKFKADILNSEIDGDQSYQLVYFSISDYSRKKMFKDGTVFVGLIHQLGRFFKTRIASFVDFRSCQTILSAANGRST